MKFVISLYLAFALNSYGSPIRIFYEYEPMDAEDIKTTLMQDYRIPEELISLVRTTNCEGLKERGKLDLCLKNNGDLFVVSVDRAFINESLRIFRAP